MKRIILLTILLALFLSACGTSSPYSELPGTEDSNTSNAPPERPVASYDYLTFEEMVLEFATDVVIAQYIGHRPFGESLTEFEFVVSERVLGDAADRIFVYAERTDAHVMGGIMVDFKPGDVSFYPGTDYLLPLMRISSPYAKTHEDGFTFLRNIVIDLNDPSNSTMYSEPLALHAEGLDFNSRTIDKQEIVSYVSELAMDIPPVWWDPIRSEVMEDIIYGSPYVLIVEINEPFRLSHEVPPTDWASTDIYNSTVVRVLKGDRDIGDFGHEFAVIFFADTVFPGEQHIVAVTPIREGAVWFDLTSRNSLFRMDQLDEILTILGHQ